MVQILRLLVCTLAVLAALGAEIIGFWFYRPVAVEPRFVYLITFAAGVFAFFSILVATKGLEIAEPSFKEHAK
jgi:hypothetical protein